jgi:serine/threonine protein kinase
MNECELFMAALGIEGAAERAAYLDQACAGEAALRQRVEVLLAALAQAGSFLQQPAADPRATSDHPRPGPSCRSDPAEGPGTVIGPYKLIEPIGEGGMGSVWMAQQTEPVKRLVAVKLIKAGMDSRQVIARFEAERQALALMDHPNIARVLDGGTTGAGRPYFVMDLVKGVPITRFCDEHRLTPRQRLDLFMDVCQAIQHAHQKGIIHRDLKPSNVLVALYDGRPVPKVIDFGVAKATGQPLTEHTLVTGFGAVVGTLEYMSPEQAELNQLDIDTRSDIYSLGVLLYELLTGTTPLEKKRLKEASLLEALRLIREEEPPRPSTRLSTTAETASVAANRGLEPKRLTGMVRGELDWIVMKALEKDRNRRYETANGFARDVQRYLAGEPVLAAPASRWYRLRKFVRRHRGAVAASGLVLLTLVGGIAGTAWGLVQAERHLKAEQQARADEKKVWRQVFAALRSMTAEVVETKFAQGAVLTETDRAFLRSIIAQFDAFAEIKGDDVDSREMRADGRFRVGVMRSTLGELQEAEKVFDQALSIYQRLAADFPTRPEYRQYLAKSHNSRGYLRSVTGRLQEAEQDYDQALSIHKRLAADFPSRPDFRQDLAGSHGNRGNLLRATGRLKEAEQDYGQALSIHKRLAADFPSRPEFRQELAKSHNNRGNLLIVTGRPGEAEKDYDQAVSIHKRLAADFLSRPDFRQELARSHDHRGNLLRYTGRPREAEQEYDQAVSIQKQLAADFPSRPEFRQDLARSLNKRGLLRSATGRPREAEQDCDQAVSIQKQLAADFPSRPEFRQYLARSHRNRAILLSNTGRPREAEKDNDEAVSIHKRLAADFPTRPEFRQDLAHSHNSRGLLRSATGRLQEAEQDHDQALSIYQRLAADFPSRPDFRQNLASSHGNRGNLLRVRGRPREAEQDHDQALSIQKRLMAEFPSLPEFRQDLAKSHNNRGLLLSATGRPQEAEQEYDQALSIYKQLAADFPNQPDLRNDLAGACVNLANHHQKQGSWTAAKRLLLEGRPHHLAALKANPRDPTYRQYYRNHLGVLTGVHAGLLEQPDAVRTAETRRGLGWNAPADAYDAVYFLSRCIPIVTRHDQLDGQQRKEAAQFYGDAAMKLLREAVSKGYRDVAHMKKDHGLNPLRPREDFQKLVAELVLAKARDYVRLSQWDKAAAEYAKADLRARPLRDDAFAYACLFLIRGDGEGYNRFCQGMIQRVAQTADPIEVYTLARSCAMARKGPVDPARAVQWAERQRSPSPWDYHVLGLAQYRAGQLDQALQSFTRANVKAWKHRELNWFGLALVHHRLGHPDEARQCLARGIQWLEREGPPGPARPASLLAQDWLAAQLLRREAEELLNIQRSP